eukprot:45995-Ditylum_brightwellii.AAC.1
MGLTVGTSKEKNKSDGEFIFFGAEHKGISKDWTLLDCESMCSVFCNPNLVKNIHEVDHYLIIKTYGGTTRTKLKCDVPCFGKVWFHKDSIANIIPLHHARKKYRITYNSENGAYFTVHMLDEDIHFVESKSGLDFHDLVSPDVMLCITT